MDPGGLDLRAVPVGHLQPVARLCDVCRGAVLSAHRDWPVRAAGAAPRRRAAGKSAALSVVARAVRAADGGHLREPAGPATAVHLARFVYRRARCARLSAVAQVRHALRGRAAGGGDDPTLVRAACGPCPGHRARAA